MDAELKREGWNRGGFLDIFLPPPWGTRDVCVTQRGWAQQVLTGLAGQMAIQWPLDSQVTGNQQVPVPVAPSAEGWQEARSGSVGPWAMRPGSCVCGERESSQEGGALRGCSPGGASVRMASGGVGVPVWPAHHARMYRNKHLREHGHALSCPARGGVHA